VLPVAVIVVMVLPVVAEEWLRLGMDRGSLGRLRSDNRTLTRRLEEKDRHIGKMLSETQRLAERLGKKDVNEIM